MDLDIHENETFQRREWRVQRAGWVLIGAFVLAGLLGLLGPGPLSWATATGNAGLVEVEYQRIGHLQADDGMTIRVAAEAVTGDSVAVVLPDEWVRAVDISGIIPEPDGQTTTPDGLELMIATEPGVAVTVSIAFRAMDMGTVDGGASIGRDTARFTQLILP